MKVVSRLAVSNFMTHRVRLALTVAAIALSVSLVVTVTSGYASIEAAAYRFLSQYLGATDVDITRPNEKGGDIAGALARDLRADPDVRAVIDRLEVETGLLDRAGVPAAGRPAQVVGLRRPDDVNVEQLEMAGGEWFDTSDGDVAVVDQVAADRLGVTVGDTFYLPSSDGRLALQVVGIVFKPGILAQHLQTVYVPIETLQRFAFPNDPDRISRIMIDLRGDVDVQAFAERWQPRLQQIDPQLRLRTTSERREGLEKNLQGLELGSYLGGTVSMLAATFIVFSALSMGVSERQRTLAMLRAIGMERRTLGWLVVFEGVLLAIGGIVIGVPLGWVWVKTLSLIPQFDQVFSAGVVLSATGALLAAVSAMLAVLAASILPAWSAMRVDPLEAMTPLAAPPSRRTPKRAAIAGLLLIAVDPMLLHGPWEALGVPDEWLRAARLYGHFGIGMPALMLGFFLLAPVVVRAFERFLGPLIAKLLALRYPLLRQQLSAGLWRAAGTCAGLMVGLAILVVLQTNGESVLSTWKLPDRFPDVFITAPVFGALSVERQEQLAQVEGIERVMPIAIASPRFSNPIFAVIGAAMMPDATMFFGVDPDRAFDMMELDFREGSPEEAQAMLKKGRHVIVTEEFRQLRGLGVGDTLALQTPVGGSIDYTIAGVVWSPGMDVVASLYDMGRQLDQRTAGSLFGTIEDARRDFGVENIFLFAADVDDSIDRDVLLERVQAELGVMGMKVGDVRRIKREITQGFRTLLLLSTAVALSAMAVASLGVTNTVMASIRTRRWQFGVLRSVGVTRWQLVRLVLAEAVLLGLVACGLGLAAGAEMVFNARGLSRTIIGFVPELAIPYGIIAVGVGAILVIAVVASIVPAVTVARTDPLTLLQGGRASA